MVLITGASRGIGQYLMNCFIDAGENVFGTYHTTVPVPNNESRFAKIDITNSDEVRAWVSQLPPEHKIILLNCAGINHNSMVHKFDLRKWKEVIDTNLNGTFNMIHAVIPRMRESGYGRIINFSSVVAQIGVPGTSAYASSKAALWGLTKAVAVENAMKGITANSLNLGYFDIGMIKEVPEDYKKSILAKIPNGHLGDPRDIYEAVRFIMNCGYLNGVSIDLNGGLL